jgi:hypothetical protein
VDDTLDMIVKGALRARELRAMLALSRLSTARCRWIAVSAP